jgi:hypothetical protein
MSNNEKHTNEILRQYINQQMIEKAPEGFTSKVMTRIQIETKPIVSTPKIRRWNMIPVVSVIITTSLILAAVLLPSGIKDRGIFAGFLNNQNINLPELGFNIDSILNLNLPVWVPYFFIAILILTIFDRALYGLFHRREE